jgi:hypothetical protein
MTRRRSSYTSETPSVCTVSVENSLYRLPCPAGQPVSQKVCISPCGGSVRCGTGRTINGPPVYGGWSHMRRSRCQPPPSKRSRRRRAAGGRRSAAQAPQRACRRRWRGRRRDGGLAHSSFEALPAGPASPLGAALARLPLTRTGGFRRTGAGFRRHAGLEPDPRVYTNFFQSKIWWQVSQEVRTRTRPAKTHGSRLTHLHHKLRTSQAPHTLSRKTWLST